MDEKLWYLVNPRHDFIICFCISNLFIGKDIGFATSVIASTKRRRNKHILRIFNFSKNSIFIFSMN